MPKDGQCNTSRELLPGDIVFLFGLVAQTDMQFAQLLFFNGSRGLREQTLGALRLRERNHVADRIGAAHHRGDAVEAEGDAAVGRRTELEGVEQEAKLLTGFFLANLEGFEDLFLHFFTVDSDGTAAHFPAVENHIVY